MEGEHETATEEMEEDGGGGPLLEPPPHATAISSGRPARIVYGIRVFTDEGCVLTFDRVQTGRAQIGLQMDARRGLKAG